MTVQTTHEGVSNDTGILSGDIDSAADALLKRWMVADKKPPTGSDKKAKDDTPSDTETTDGEEESETDTSDSHEDDTEDTEAEDADEAEEDDEDGAKPRKATDDDEVEVSVDGKTTSFKVKDLKRLAGQEAALTRKSQEIAAIRKTAEEQAQRHSTALDVLLKRAQEKFEPYSKLDMLTAMKTLDAEAFAQLRKDAEAAYTDLKFFQEEIDKAQKTATEERKKNLTEMAKKAVEVLEKRIPGWSKETYSAIRSYAVESGLTEDEVNSIVDPTAIELINKARLYDQMKKKAATKKKAAAPKNTVKTTKAADDTATSTETYKKALALARSTGDSDAAVDALLAKWRA